MIFKIGRENASLSRYRRKWHIMKRSRPYNKKEIFFFFIFSRPSSQARNSQRTTRNANFWICMSKR